MAFYKYKKEVQNCNIFQRCEDEQVVYPGLLQPLPISSRPWEHISMNFIDGLPKSKGNDIILVIVDMYSKYAHFLTLAYPYTAAQIVALFLDNI